ncbi:Chromosome partition protein Smc [Corynebacterium atrinae]|uniref:zinc ribbon domain-containing protein n=1 Tax=Corynebacterium atrinae TaxID=1336740 RepID=UPI0025B56DA8|nr:C4-type zinc ribbon domain-containing protein [Corynebacterium atrinae]WJY63890.1 Chromosome partition protein Smc [Corynebacterium atrinae]
MKLDPSLQELLLELSSIERSLEVVGDAAFVTEEQKEFDRLTKELARMRNAASSSQMAVDDMEAEILRIQEDERKLRRRERDDKAQLTAETDPERRKDLEHDRYSAKSRIADLMSELAETHNQIHALRNNRDVHGARVDELTRQVEAAARAAEAANAAHTIQTTPEQRIAELRGQLPADVVAEYDLQKKDSGVGAADFNGRTCGGCFMVLGAADQNRVRKAAADELPQCPECGTYLIRKTA